ncbi:MAG: hypothetical protein LBH36_00145 [Candidatus Nomurabacteria bacterium]|nr:hypothetical protein [Candidatus Nomurabacteria bacterium]
MKLKKTLGNFLPAALLLAITFGLSQVATHAADGATTSGSLSIAPAERRITVDPDDTYTADASGAFVLHVSNTSEKPMTIGMQARPLNVTNATYDKFDFQKETLRTQLSRWIVFDKSQYTIGANETVEVPFRVAVPPDPPSGGQYAVIAAVPIVAGEQAKDQAELAASSALTWVYARVSGEIHQEAKVQSVTIDNFQLPKYDNGKNQQPVQGATVVKNSGNVDLKVETELLIYSVFNYKEVAKTKTIQADVLPGTERKIVAIWEDSPAIGLFKVKQVVRVMNKGHEITQVVLIVPIWLLVAAPVALVLLIVTAVVLVALKRRKKSGAKPKQARKKVKLEAKEDI